MRQQLPPWRVGPPVHSPRPDTETESWLRGTLSLTARLRRRCPGRFAVRVLAEGWARPSLDEARRLRLGRGRYAWVREVALCCGDRPQVFARSVVPGSSLVGENRALRLLGARPLGELLFAWGGTQRDALEIACLKADSWLLQRMCQLGVEQPGALWARRRVHWLNRRPLLVAEVFLPELFR